MDTLRDGLQEREHLSEYRLVTDRSTIYLVEPGQTTDLVHRKVNVVIHELVDVLRPFYRDGRHIPDLLQPRAHVSVDPAVRGGMPVIDGTRVPYDEVAALLRDGVPAERISEFYPSVSATAALDAADFADYVDSDDPPREQHAAAAGWKRPPPPGWNIPTARLRPGLTVTTKRRSSRSEVAVRSFA